MTYELIAFDMDGTLLDSTKKVLPSSIEAIREAQEAGKAVAICSGRCPAMITMHAAELPGVRYAVCGSGAALYDIAEDQVLATFPIEPELIVHVGKLVQDEDVMPEIFAGKGFFYQRDQLAIMDHFSMGIYQHMYGTMGTPVDDMKDMLVNPQMPYLKFNLHFATAEARARVRAQIEDLPLELIDSEASSLELSPKGINKGTGLLALADKLGIDHAATISVGDADNDLAALRMAGLGLAMANANENAKQAADVVLGHDNDHGGCAEAVRRFLLGGETVGTATGAATR